MIELELNFTGLWGFLLQDDYSVVFRENYNVTYSFDSFNHN